MRKPQMRVDLPGNSCLGLSVCTSFLFLCTPAHGYLAKRNVLCTASEHYSRVLPIASSREGRQTAQILSSVLQGTLVCFFSCRVFYAPQFSPRGLQTLPIQVSMATVLRRIGKTLHKENVLSDGSLGALFFKLMLARLTNFFLFVNIYFLNTYCMQGTFKPGDSTHGIWFSSHNISVRQLMLYPIC